MSKNRFEENNEDFDFDDESFEEYLSDVESDEMMPSGFKTFHQDELYAQEQQINSIVLQQAFDLVSSSFLWRFRSIKYKIQILTDTYYALLDLVREE